MFDTEADSFINLPCHHVNHDHGNVLAKITPTRPTVEFRVGWGLSDPVVLLNNDSLLLNIKRFDVMKDFSWFALPLSLYR